MRLFIAEKPSVGRELSQVLPNPQSAKRHDGYIVQGKDVITWAFGHMLEQVDTSFGNLIPYQFYQLYGN